MPSFDIIHGGVFVLRNINTLPGTKPHESCKKYLQQRVWLDRSPTQRQRSDHNRIIRLLVPRNTYGNVFQCITLQCMYSSEVNKQHSAVRDVCYAFALATPFFTISPFIVLSTPSVELQSRQCCPLYCVLPRKCRFPICMIPTVVRHS